MKEVLEVGAKLSSDPIYTGLEPIRRRRFMALNIYNFSGGGGDGPKQPEQRVLAPMLSTTFLKRWGHGFSFTHLYTMAWSSTGKVAVRKKKYLVKMGLRIKGRSWY